VSALYSACGSSLKLQQQISFMHRQIYAAATGLCIGCSSGSNSEVSQNQEMEDVCQKVVNIAGTIVEIGCIMDRRTQRIFILVMSGFHFSRSPSPLTVVQDATEFFLLGYGTLLK